MEFFIEENRIWREDDNGKVVAYITYPKVGENIVEINHTFVDESLAGQGVASNLVGAAVMELRADGRRAKVSCSYAKKWFEKHPDERGILIEDQEL